MPEVYDRCLGPALFAPSPSTSPRSPPPSSPAACSNWPPAPASRPVSSCGGCAVWQRADAQDLRPPPGSADLVVCQFGVMFFPSRPKAYAEIAPPGRSADLRGEDSARVPRSRTDQGGPRRGRSEPDRPRPCGLAWACPVGGGARRRLLPRHTAAIRPGTTRAARGGLFRRRARHDVQTRNWTRRGTPHGSRGGRASGKRLGSRSATSGFPRPVPSDGHNRSSKRTVMPM